MTDQDRTLVRISFETIQQSLRDLAETMAQKVYREAPGLLAAPPYVGPTMFTMIRHKETIQAIPWLEESFRTVNVLPLDEIATLKVLVARRADWRSFTESLPEQKRIPSMTAETPACFAVEFESNRREATDLCFPHDETTKLLAVATEEVLISGAKSGDRSAFVELWARYSKVAFNMAYRITGNQEDAEDVVQDAWLRAYVHLNSFDGRSKFSTWLTRIAINSALGILRRKRARPETSMEITDGEAWQHWEIADETKNIEDLYARHQEVERLRRAIRRLQPTLRRVVEIHQLDDRSVKEIADLAGISVAATKARLLRARRILRKTLAAS